MNSCTMMENGPDEEPILITKEPAGYVIQVLIEQFERMTALGSNFTHFRQTELLRATGKFFETNSSWPSSKFNCLIPLAVEEISTAETYLSGTAVPMTFPNRR